MNAPYQNALRPDTTVIEHLRPLRPYLDDPAVTEVCVNRPGEVWVEAHGRWTRHDVPSLDFGHCRSLATAVATLSGQYTSEADPLLGAPLPGGERIQFVQPSACPADTIVLCIRKPPTTLWRLADFEAMGLFDRIRPPGGGLGEVDQALMRLLRERRYADFLRLAVRSRRTLVVAGKTGSGKTTLMRALVEEVPSAERLVTIEDTAELALPSHPNRVHLFYSKGGQGASAVSAQQLLEACLRLRPDRILLAEVRGAEAYAFLRLAASGHPGSMTSLHAGSCEEAFEQLALMVRESAAGGGMTMPEIARLARSVVDIVVHLDVDAEVGAGAPGRHITGIHFDPAGTGP